MSRDKNQEVRGLHFEGNDELSALLTAFNYADMNLPQMHPGENVDIDRLISAIPPFDEYQVNGRFQSTGSKLPAQYSTFVTATGSTSTPSECSDESEPEDLSHIALAEDLKKLHSLATANRYFGPARHVFSPWYSLEPAF